MSAITLEAREVAFQGKIRRITQLCFRVLANHAISGFGPASISARRGSSNGGSAGSSLGLGIPWLILAVLLQKSFCEVGLKFSDPQVQRLNHEVGDHVAKRRTRTRFWW